MVVRRSKSMREDGAGHPTRNLIISVTAAILKEKGVGGLHIDDVLDATGLTRGAVYHHFDGVDDLVQHALLATYAEGVDANIAFIRDVMGSATTAEKFRAGILRANIAYATNEHLRFVRRLRAHAMAVTATSPVLAAAIAREQQRLTDEYVDLIADAQSRGWVRVDVDATVLATFVQAYSFGIIVDDVSESHIGSKKWASFIANILEEAVFASR